MRLKQLKHPDLTSDARYDLVVPIGSLEQHGPFIPFGTDTYITDYLVDQLEERFPDLVIVPTLEFSRAQEHKDFFGTIYLSEETFLQALFDICHSLYAKADHVFLTSFHANDAYIQRFIAEKASFFSPATIVHLAMYSAEDEEVIEELLGGPMDDHAGNTEISNMLALDLDSDKAEKLVVVPSEHDQKVVINEPFATDNLADKSENGIADNHPKWVVNKAIGQQILDIYVERMVQNVAQYINKIARGFTLHFIFVFI